jgi:hypothetical protein
VAAIGKTADRRTRHNVITITTFFPLNLPDKYPPIKGVMGIV